jgi:MOSC domain-containing protein YiiM
METIRGKIAAISISNRKGIPKTNISSARLIAGVGIERDAHAGEDHRQVSLLAIESIAVMQQRGVDVMPGSFAENITTAGIELSRLKVGDMLQIGEARLEITQIGKVCHARCAIYDQAGDCIMPREGLFAKVVSGGVIRTDDPIIAALIPEESA